MQRGIFPQNFKTLIVISKKVFKIEELDALTPIKNEEAKFLCGGAEPTLQSDLSKTEGNSTHSSSADAYANTQDSDELQIQLYVLIHIFQWKCIHK